MEPLEHRKTVAKFLCHERLQGRYLRIAKYNYRREYHYFSRRPVNIYTTSNLVCLTYTLQSFH